ncbi:MAG: SMI1/KNR4 family protein [Roseovarius sp.]|uniref:SMI1/KNR4 family protein n=1 Tax=Roseovarius sp. TaxID=1486281 RepID=UPI0032EE0372
MKPYDLQSGERVLPKQEVERLIGHPIPADLIQFIPQGGTPFTFEEEIRISVEEANPLPDKNGRQLVLVVFGLTNGKNGIPNKYFSYKDRIGRKCIPFADDGLGNLFVLAPDNGAVYFWHHESKNGETSLDALTRVSDCVGSFISGLEIVEEDAQAAIGSGVKRVSFGF